MDRKPMQSRLSLLLLMGFAISVPLQLSAQVPVDKNGNPLVALDGNVEVEDVLDDIPQMTSAELEELVGPIALYPDDLLAIVLPASTFPLEIVQAARFLDEFEADSSLEPDEAWDESVVALLNYPEVIRMMDEEIDWTWRLGEAVIAQQSDVIAAVESFRDRAYAAGNLESDERQTVSNEDSGIRIDPVDDEIIYVPYYEPEEVVVYQPRRVYHYYPHAYPVYYYPYPVGHNFYSGYFWGVTTAYTIGWSNHYLHVYHPSYWGHPYYGRYYYGHYYRRPSISVYNSWYVNNSYNRSRYRHRDGDYWRPRHRRSGARPASQRVRNYHYPSGSNDRNRDNTRSTARTRQDVQDRNRISSDRSRPTSAGNTPRTRVTANNDRRSSGSGNTSRRTSANNTPRSRSGSDANRSRQTGTGTRDRTGVSDRNNNRIERGGDNTSNTAIQFRQRSDNGSSRRTGATGSSRQRIAAGNGRQANGTTRTSSNRVTSQRSTPTRQTTTAPRSGSSQRPASNRPTSRPAMQRQAPIQQSAPPRQSAPRQSAPRQSAPRQSAPRQSAPRQSAPRQSAPRQAAPSSSRGQSGAKPQQRQSSSRGNSQRKRRIN